MTPFICTHDKTNGTTREAHWEKNPCGHAKMRPWKVSRKVGTLPLGIQPQRRRTKKIGIKTRLNNGFSVGNVHIDAFVTNRLRLHCNQETH